MRIRYSAHAKEKLRLLAEFGVSERIVEEALGHPRETYYDTLIGSMVSIVEMDADRGAVVVFTTAAEVATIITVYYTTRLNTVRRGKLSSGRWVKLGES